MEDFEWAAGSSELFDSVFAMRFEEMDGNFMHEFLGDFPFESYLEVPGMAECKETISNNQYYSWDEVGFSSIKSMLDAIEVYRGAKGNRREIEHLLQEKIREAVQELRDSIRPIGGKYYLFRAMTLDPMYLGSNAGVEKYLRMLERSSYGNSHAGVGRYWAVDEDHAVAHWAGKGDTVVLEIEAVDNQIDWLDSAKIYFTSLWAEEKEIRMKANQKVVLVQITDADGRRYEAGFDVRI